MYSNQSLSNPDLHISHRSDPFNYSLSINDSSFIRKLPGKNNINLQGHVQVALLFQAAQIQRLNSVLDGSRVYSRGKTKQSLDRHSYQIQIKQLSSMVQDLRNQKQGLQKYIRDMRNSMQMKDSLALSATFQLGKVDEQKYNKLADKYERALLQIERMYTDNCQLQKQVNQLNIEIIKMREDMNSFRNRMQINVQQISKQIQHTNHSQKQHQEQLNKQKQQLQRYHRSIVSQMETQHAQEIANIRNQFAQEITKYKNNVQQQMGLKMEQQKNRVKEIQERESEIRKQNGLLQMKIKDKEMEISKLQTDVRLLKVQNQNMENNISDMLRRRKQEDIQRNNYYHNMTANNQNLSKRRQVELQNTVAMLSQQLQRLTTVIKQKNKQINTNNEQNNEQLLRNKHRYEQQMAKKQMMVRNLQENIKNMEQMHRNQIKNMENRIHVEQQKRKQELNNLISQNRLKVRQIQIQKDEQIQNLHRQIITKNRQFDQLLSQQQSHRNTEYIAKQQMQKVVKNIQQQFLENIRHKQNQWKIREKQRQSDFNSQLHAYRMRAQQLEELIDKNDEKDQIIVIMKKNIDEHQEEKKSIKHKYEKLDEIYQEEIHTKNKQVQQIKRYYQEQLTYLKQQLTLTQHQNSRKNSHNTLILQYLEKISEEVNKIKTQLFFEFQNAKQGDQSRIKNSYEIKYAVDDIGGQINGLSEQIRSIKLLLTGREKEEKEKRYSAEYVDKLQEQIVFLRNLSNKSGGQKKILEELEHQRWAANQEQQKWRVTINKQQNYIEQLTKQVTKYQKLANDMDNNRKQHLQQIEKSKSRQIQAIKQSHIAQISFYEEEINRLNKQISQKMQQIEQKEKKIQQKEEEMEQIRQHYRNEINNNQMNKYAQYEQQINQLHQVIQHKGGQIEKLKNITQDYQIQCENYASNIQDIKQKLSEFIEMYHRDAEYIHDLEKEIGVLKIQVSQEKGFCTGIVEDIKGRVCRIVENLETKQVSHRTSERLNFQTFSYPANRFQEENTHKTQKENEMLQLNKYLSKLERTILQLKNDNISLIRQTYTGNSQGHVFRQFSENKMRQLNKQIDRLAGQNLDLKDQICRCRVEYAREWEHQKRDEENLAIMVLLFAEIESLRSKYQKNLLKI